MGIESSIIDDLAVQWKESLVPLSPAPVLGASTSSASNGPKDCSSRCPYYYRPPTKPSSAAAFRGALGSEVLLHLHSKSSLGSSIPLFVVSVLPHGDDNWAPSATILRKEVRRPSSEMNVVRPA